MYEVWDGNRIVYISNRYSKALGFWFRASRYAEIHYNEELNI